MTEGPTGLVLAAMVAAGIPVTSLSVARLTEELLARGCEIDGIQRVDNPTEED